MNFFNLGLVLTCGLTVGSCLSMPVIVNLVKEHSPLTAWIDKVSANIPILNCNQHGKHYKIYLTSREIKEWNERDSKNYISLKVLDSNNKDHLVWGPELREEEKWTNWALRLEGGGGKVSLKVPKEKNQFLWGDHISINCDNQRKIELKDKGDSSMETVISAVKDQEDSRFGREIFSQNIFSFNLTDCKNLENRRECNISFDAENKLKWAEGFDPKIYFPLKNQKN